MTGQFIYMFVAGFAAFFGAFAGRVFAMEAENRRTAIFAAAYVGAGVGLLSALPIASTLTLIAKLMSPETEPSTYLDTFFNALDVTGTAIFWGVAGGAAGGLLISLIVVAIKRWEPKRP